MVLGIAQETPVTPARTLSQECAVSIGGGELEPICMCGCSACLSDESAVEFHSQSDAQHSMVQTQ